MREWTLGEGVIAWLYKRASFFCMYSWRRLSIDDDEEEIVWESFCGGGWLCNLLLWCLGDSHMLHHILHHGHPIAFVVANPILPIQSWGDSSNQNYRCWSTYHSWKTRQFLCFVGMCSWCEGHCIASNILHLLHRMNWSSYDIHLC